MGFIAELLAFMEVRRKFRLLPILIIGGVPVSRRGAAPSVGTVS